MELNAPSKLFFLISQTSYYDHKRHIAVAGTIIQSSQWKTWLDTMFEFRNMIIPKFFMGHDNASVKCCWRCLFGNCQIMAFSIYWIVSSGWGKIVLTLFDFEAKYSTSFCIMIWFTFT